jgi:nicotinate phosphoribosyltransferase
MKGGMRLEQPEPLADIRARAAGELASLPAHLRELKDSPPYPVEISKKLKELKEDIEKEIASVEK